MIVVDRNALAGIRLRGGLGAFTWCLAASLCCSTFVTAALDQCTYLVVQSITYCGASLPNAVICSDLPFLLRPRFLGFRQPTQCRLERLEPTVAADRAAGRLGLAELSESRCGHTRIGAQEHRRVFRTLKDRCNPSSSPGTMMMGNWLGIGQFRSRPCAPLRSANHGREHFRRL